MIGNDNYVAVPKLQKAGNDATTMAGELRAAGFEVLLHHDLSYRNMVKAINALVGATTGGDEVVFFFAGHGVQIKSGNYLLPVDIEATNEAEVEKTAYALSDLMEQLGEAKAAFSLVMVDACRDNPLKTKGRSIGGARGLIPPEPPKGQMVVYSASRGQQALDRLTENDPNPNSVFTREFVSRMRKPGVRIEELVREVQDSVEALARSVSYEQRPAFYNEARGNFYFFGPVAMHSPTPAVAALGANEADREDRFWEDTKGAGNREGFEAYLELYPRGRYANLARAHINRLSAQQKTAVTPSASLPQAATVVAPTLTVSASDRPGGADYKASGATELLAATPQVTTAVSRAVKTTRVSLPNGDLYEGELVGSVRSGRGVYQFTNGDRYEGSFANDLFNGEGVLTQANGDRYEGPFKNGKPDGKGTYYFKSGDVYEGEFRNHLKEGQGVLFFASGDRYEGQFKDGLQFGTGTYFHANGDRYTGSFAEGERHGKGTYLFSSGLTREFEYLKGKEKAASQDSSLRSHTDAGS